MASRNPYYSGQPNDHFDGLRFFNPNHPDTDRSFADILRWKANPPIDLPQPPLAVVIVGVFTAIAVAGSPRHHLHHGRTFPGEQKPMLIFKPLEPARRDVVLDVRRGGVRSRVSRKPFSHLLVFPARVPDSSISDSTSGITTYQYDGLNRVTLVAPGAVFALSFREAKRRGNPLSARDIQHWTTMGWSTLSSKQEEAAPSFAIFKGWDYVRTERASFPSTDNQIGKYKIKGSRD